MGKCNLKLKCIDEAQRYFNQALSINSKSLPALINLANTYLQEGDQQKAIELFRKATLIEPNNASAKAFLANAYFQKGQHKKAEETIKTSIELNPKLFNAHFLLATILIEQNKLSLAEIHLYKTIELNTEFFHGYFTLGSLLQKQGKLVPAEKYLRKAVELNPNNSQAHFILASILIGQKKLQEAEKPLLRTIELNPNFVDAYENLGAILNDLGRLDEAKKYLNIVIQLDPNYAKAYIVLSSIYAASGNLKKALEFNIKAVDIEPNNLDFSTPLLELLSLYKSNSTNPNRIVSINEEYNQEVVFISDLRFINDDYAISIYSQGQRLYNKHNLNLETFATQIYKRSNYNLNCLRHKTLFNNHKVIPEFCFSCYKVQIEPRSILELLKLYIFFDLLNLEKNNTRKCLIEIREAISGNYKGLIYCSSLDEAIVISRKVDSLIGSTFSEGLKSTIKRGCSEYPLEYPLYKEINYSGEQPMKYNEDWRSIENDLDNQNRQWPQTPETINGFNLNSFLIMRNWVAYAQFIKDTTVNKITNERVVGGISTLLKMK